MAERDAIVRRLMEVGGVPVLRLPDRAQVPRVIEACAEGGLPAAEITMTVPGALESIAEGVRRFGETVMIGVGSVLDGATAKAAIDAGAAFVVSPIFEPEVIEAAHARGVPAAAGAFTPTEAHRAHAAGADIVKIFPADVVGIPFIRGVLAPMPHLRLMPTGGVTPENAGDWVRAGCAAVGVGSALLKKRAIAEGDYAAIAERARVMRASIDAARSELG